MARSLWVLIAAAGKPALLGRTLASLAATAKPACYRGALVVENGPRCGIEEVVRSMPSEQRVRHLYVPEANKSHALNCGLSQIDDGLVFMTDDDVRLDSQVLFAYAEAARHVERGEFYGGPVLIDAEHGLPQEWMRRFYPLTIAEPWTLPHEGRTVLKEQNFMGTNWAAFASDLRAAGGFDTRLGPGGTTGAAGQETEAQRRLLDREVQSVYVPEAVAWHYLHREFLEPPWVLKRAYRHALEWGIRRTRDERGTLAGLLRGALGRTNAHAKGLALRMLGGEQRRFEAAFHEAKWRGRWEGLWLGRRWNSLPIIAAPAFDGRSSRAA
jgi:glycosyltransferase involved in cell wall biosynthesis